MSVGITRKSGPTVPNNRTEPWLGTPDNRRKTTLIAPVLVHDYPATIRPLAKRMAEDPCVTDRFELFVVGMEPGNAFSELNDPIDQEQRFEEQSVDKDEDSPGEVDVDYVTALEFGMPSASGIGIDRLCMLLTGSTSIRDVVLFLLLRRIDANATQGEDKPQ